MPDRRALTIAMTALLSAILISGCGLISSFPGVGAPDAPGAVGPGIPDPAPPGGGAGGGAAGGGVGDGDIGIGIDLPAPGGNVVIPDDPTLIVVHPGQVGLHDVSPVELKSRIDNAGHVIVRVRWWGGIEPCEVLDSVDVVRDGSTLTIALRVGSAGGKIACIEIARDTATLVDLGILPAGQYTVRAATGDAPAITVTVPGPGPS